MKRKICVYVSEDLVSRLAVAAEQRGATKSGLVGAALDHFLDVAGDEDHRPGVDERLAQMGQQLDQHIQFIIDVLRKNREELAI